MKYLMGFLFALVPALIVGGVAYLFVGPLALLFAGGVFGLGMGVCFNGSDSRTHGLPAVDSQTNPPADPHGY